MQELRNRGSHEVDKGGSVASLRLVFRVSACAMVLFAFTAPLAHAGLISGLLPGLISPSDTPATCNTSSSQAFAKVDGDYSNYVLVPGGAFEAGAAGWTLGRSVAVGSGNEPWKVLLCGKLVQLGLVAPGARSRQEPARRSEHSRRRQDLVELDVAAVGPARPAADESDGNPRDGLRLVPVRSVGDRLVADRRRLPRPLEERLSR